MAILRSRSVGTLVVIDDTTGQHRALRFQALPHHDEAKLVKPAERSQVRARESSSVKHVEVFRVGGVGTSIFGRPRPSARHRRAAHTVKSEEPVIQRRAQRADGPGGGDAGDDAVVTVPVHRA